MLFCNIYIYVFCFLSFEHICFFEIWHVSWKLILQHVFYFFSSKCVVFYFFLCFGTFFIFFPQPVLNSKCFSCILPSCWCLGQVACFASSRDNTRKFLVWIGTSLHQDMVSLAYLPLKLRTRKCTCALGCLDAERTDEIATSFMNNVFSLFFWFIIPGCLELQLSSGLFFGFGVIQFQIFWIWNCVSDFYLFSGFGRYSSGISGIIFFSTCFVFFVVLDDIVPEILEPSPFSFFFSGFGWSDILYIRDFIFPVWGIFW